MEKVKIENESKKLNFTAIQQILFGMTKVLFEHNEKDKKTVAQHVELNMLLQQFVKQLFQFYV